MFLLVSGLGFIGGDQDEYLGVSGPSRVGFCKQPKPQIDVPEVSQLWAYGSHRCPPKRAKLRKPVSSGSRRGRAVLMFKTEKGVGNVEIRGFSDPVVV